MSRYHGGLIRDISSKIKCYYSKELAKADVKSDLDDVPMYIIMYLSSPSKYRGWNTFKFRDLNNSVKDHGIRSVEDIYSCYSVIWTSNSMKDAKYEADWDHDNK